MPTQCVKSLNQQSTRSNCCWIINKSSETDCAYLQRTVFTFSPSDSLRFLMLLHPNFLQKNLQCQNDGKGKAQAWHGEHLISVQMHLFPAMAVTVLSKQLEWCKALLSFQVPSPPQVPLPSPFLLILSSRLPPHAMTQRKWLWLVCIWEHRRHPEITLYCYRQNLNLSAVLWLSGLPVSGSSTSVRSSAFIPVMQQQFNHSSNLKHDSRNDTAKFHFHLSQQLQIAAVCCSALGTVCLFLRFSGVGFCFDLKAGEREGKATVNLKNPWTGKMCVLFEIMHVISCLFICDCNYSCVDNVGVRG